MLGLDWSTRMSTVPLSYFHTTYSCVMELLIFSYWVEYMIFTPIIHGKYTPNEKDGARVYSTIKQNILLFIFVSVKIKIKSNIHITLSSSVSMISAGSVWRNGKSTAHQREAIIDAPAMRSSSRWRSSQRRWLKRYTHIGLHKWINTPY